MMLRRRGGGFYLVSGDREEGMMRESLVPRVVRLCSIVPA